MNQEIFLSLENTFLAEVYDMIPGYVPHYCLDCGVELGLDGFFCDECDVPAQDRVFI